MDQTNPNMNQSSSSGEQKKNTGMAMIAYILFFVPLLTDAKNDPFVKYHVKQGLVLFIFAVASSIITMILPIIGWMLSPILNLIVIVLLIMGIMNASGGKEKELPVIGKFAENFTF